MIEFLQSLHGIIILSIIIGIVIWQSIIFLSTWKKVNNFKDTFPDNSLFYFNDGQILFSDTFSDKSIFSNIIDSINNYLNNNKSAVSDFHLMKDIVDRNCDALEEEINTQIPVPLYLGLVGTMLGILFGVGFLVFDGGLQTLLNSNEGNSADGIEALLGGVSMAMVSSIIGILLTTAGSSLNKNATSKVEKNKNSFLSWIQAELLPNLPNDVSGAMVKMSYNLSAFNNVFSKNSDNLRITLEQVNKSSRGQAILLEKIDKLRINEIATANVQVYEKLKNATYEIGQLGGYLKDVRDYSKELQDVVTNFHKYFTEELSQIEQRKGYIAEAVGKVDDYLQQSLHKLKNSAEIQLNEYKLAIGTADNIFLEALSSLEDHVKNQFAKLTYTTDIHQEDFKKTLYEIEKALREKLHETSALVDELKNLAEIKKAVANFEKITEKQNGKIDELTRSIKELAQTKASGEIKVTTQMPLIPKWIKFSIIAAGSLISATCLAVLLPLLIEWISKLIN